MNFFNFNFLHNLINVVIIALGAALIASGCEQLATGALDCSKSWINPQITTIAITALAALKVIMNVLRDGLFGLIKVQPPVVDKPVLK
jgi:xanthine/uracil permease